MKPRLSQKGSDRKKLKQLEKQLQRAMMHLRELCEGGEFADWVGDKTMCVAAYKEYLDAKAFLDEQTGSR